MRGSIALAIVVVAAVTAHAEPWEDGVAKRDQERANALFADGNLLFARQAHAPALAKYREALALWNHPVIRFNAAVALFNLERFVESADELDAALEFGNAPFSATQLKQIEEYQTKLRERVGEVSATCESKSTRVLLDGNEWFTCPGSGTRRVLAGEHAVVA